MLFGGCGIVVRVFVVAIERFERVGFQSIGFQPIGVQPVAIERIGVFRVE